MTPTFYLGTHRPYWLGWTDVPLFVSHRTLRDYVTLPRALGPWVLDSGGYSELNDPPHRWTITPRDYVAAVRRYRDEVGNLQWVAPMDWLCSPEIVAKTRHTVPVHQWRTVHNLFILRELAPDLPIVPVLQGWTTEDYLRCADLYEVKGLDLAAEPVVAVGTIVARQDTAVAAEVVDLLTARGYRLHGLGIKLRGLSVYGAQLTSVDSLAWSYRARRAARDRVRTGVPTTCPEGKDTCANCLHFALEWRTRALEVAASSSGSWQPGLFTPTEDRQPLPR